jgi:hypothetical protein
VTVSPYYDVPRDQWRAITEKLVAEHPIGTGELVDVVLTTWHDIFESRIGAREYQIGVHIHPSPQIMGSFLHELIPLEFQFRNAGLWRRAELKNEKDLVHIPDPAFSVEIKTSSHGTKIFGNRSYAQPAEAGISAVRKGKSGYYLAINFEKCDAKLGRRPAIIKVRFGWLDHSDWIPQRSATGQQAYLDPHSEATKLIMLPLPGRTGG